MRVHGRIAAAAITAALSLDVVAVPAVAEEAVAADQQAAVVLDAVQVATQPQPKVEEVDGQTAASDAQGAPTADAQEVPTFSVEEDLAGKELVQLSTDNGKTYQTVAVKADTVSYVGKVSQGNDTYEVMVNLDYADDAKMAEYLPAGANAADYEFRMGYSNQHIYLMWDASAQQWVASPNNKCKLTFKGPEAPEVVTAPDDATVALQAHVRIYDGDTYLKSYGLEAGHYTRGEVAKNADGTYSYTVSLDRDDLKYYTAEYAKETGKNYYMVSGSPTMLSMYWNTGTNPHQWIAGESLGDDDATNWNADVKVAEVAEPTDAEVAKCCYVNVYEQGSDKVVAKYKLEAGHFDRWSLEKAADGTVGYKVSVSADDLKYYASKYAKETGRNFYAVDPKAQVLEMHFDTTNPFPQWMGGAKVGDFSGSYRAVVTVAEVAEPTDDEVAENCMADIYVEGQEDAVAEYQLEAGHYTRGELAKGEDGVIGYTVTLTKDDIEYYAKKYAQETGKPYAAVDTTPITLHMYFDADNPTPQWMGGVNEDDWDGTWVADITVKDIALTTDDVNATMGEPAVYVTDRDGNLIKAYDIIDGTYTVEYDGTHARLTIVGQGQQAYIDKLNGENPGKFYVSENGLTTVPLSYELEYANGKWELSSVGQYQMAVWDVAPITGKVKVTDGTTTKEYDLAEGTFTHTSIAYDDEAGACRTTITLTDYDAYVAKYSAEMGRTYRRAAGSADVTYELVYDMGARPRKRAWTMAGPAVVKPAPRHIALMAVAKATVPSAPQGNDTIQVELVPHTVTFDHGYDADGDGTNDSEQATVADGDAATMSQLTRDGYTFEGWKTADGADYDAAAPVTSDLVLVAQWKKVEEPAKPAEAKPAQTAQTAAPAKKATAKTQAIATPQTGDATSGAAAAGLLAAGIGLVAASRRRRDEE